MGLFEMWNSWVWFAGAALGLMTTLIAIVYMLAELLQNEKMKSWAKMELAEIFYSALIISIGIFGAQAIDQVVQGSLGVSNIGPSMTGTQGCAGSVTSFWIKTSDYGQFTLGQQGVTKRYECLDICGTAIAKNQYSVYNGIESCHMRLSIWYMRELFDESRNFAFDIYMDYIKKSIIQEFTINVEFIFEKAGFFTFTPWRGFYTMGNKVKELCFDWVTKLMMLMKFQEVTLRFIAVALFPALFVSGAVLRSFAFTRKLGGLLLAMGISLYFVFPAFYAFAAIVLLDLKNDPVISKAWVTRNPANPGCWAPPTFDCMSNPDPPIANTMYFRGDIVIPGGKGNFSSDEARAAMWRYEGYSPQDYEMALEKGSSGSDPLMPQFDLTSKAYDKASSADRDTALFGAWQQASNWFGTVSNESAVDRFLDFAWDPDGPLDVMGRLTFWSTFFSLLSVISTIAAIRSLAVTFGGDIEIAGLTRLI